ncbi:MAG: flagellar hook-basal body complex protein FliE [Armatimonadota bacterium]
MFLKLLGSAAAEGWPALFCACEACREARRLGGKNLRRRTSYQLGDTVHVDFGPDSFSSMLAKMVSEVSQKQNVASKTVAALQSGQPVTLHQAMISMEEASVSFSLMAEVRNKDILPSH